MAKSYIQRNLESIAKYGRSLYERRIESAQARGLSRAQARGHAREAKGEQKPSEIKAQVQARPEAQAKPEVQLKARPVVKAPKVSEELKSIPRVTYAGGNKIMTVRSEQAAYKAIQDAARHDKRVIITVYGRDGQPHTIYVSPTSKTRYGAGATAQWILDQMDDNGLSLDEQLELNYSEGSCGPLPEIGDIAVYQIQFIDAPTRAA